MLSIRRVLRTPRLVTKVIECPHLVTRGNTSIVYGFDMARMLKVLLAGLMFGNVGVEIPTYVRNDNSDAVYRADSVNTATNEKRLNGFLESNREALEKNDWLSVGYIPGDANTSDGVTKAMSSSTMRDLVTHNTCRIVTEEAKKEIGPKNPTV